MVEVEPIGSCGITALADRAVGKQSLPADLESPCDAALEPCDAQMGFRRSNDYVLPESAHSRAVRDAESDPAVSWR